MIVQITDVDQHITTWVVDHRTAPLTGLAHVVTVFGNTITLWIVATLVVIALAARKHVTEAVYVGLGSLLGASLMVILKHLVRRERPPRDDRLLHIDHLLRSAGLRRTRRFDVLEFRSVGVDGFGIADDRADLVPGCGELVSCEQGDLAVPADDHDGSHTSTMAQNAPPDNLSAGRRGLLSDAGV